MLQRRSWPRSLLFSDSDPRRHTSLPVRDFTRFWGQFWEFFARATASAPQTDTLYSILLGRMFFNGKISNDDEQENENASSQAIATRLSWLTANQLKCNEYARDVPWYQTVGLTCSKSSYLTLIRLLITLGEAAVKILISVVTGGQERRGQKLCDKWMSSISE